MARKSYCIVDDKNETVTVVVEKLTKGEAATVKGLKAIGYTVIRTTAEALYPSEGKYTKENVYAYLETLDKKVKEKFEKIAAEIATDENGAAKRYKNGTPRKKSYVGALKWFRSEYEADYLKWLDKQ